MRVMRIVSVWTLLMLAGAGSATAQNWRGVYVGGSAGGLLTLRGSGETVRFDTGLDGAFGDTVRTAGGADAFSPGFCGGRAINATAASGCATDKKGADFGGRLGYDWQAGSFVFGALGEVSRTDVTDAVTAFSVTPAFYTMSREQRYVAGFRGRIGVAMNRVLGYGTAGPAWGQIDQSFSSSNIVNTFVAVNQEDASGRENIWGYQAGAGAEVKLGGRITVFGEYLFTSLDNRERSIIRAQGPAPATNAFILVNPAGTNFQRQNRFDTHIGKFGVNLRF